MRRRFWRTRGEHMPLVGEFAFQVQFPSRDAVAQKSKDLCAQFYITLQHAVKDWISLGNNQDRDGLPPEGYHAPKQ